MTNAEKLASVLLDAEESPKEFLKRRGVAKQHPWRLMHTAYQGPHPIEWTYASGKNRFFHLIPLSRTRFTVEALAPDQLNWVVISEPWEETSYFSLAVQTAMRKADRYYSTLRVDKNVTEAEEETPKQFLKRQDAKPTKPGWIEDYRIEDIGFENHSYFQGRGPSMTQWDAVEVGTGENPREALDDALTQLAEQDWLVDKIPNTLPKVPTVSAKFRSIIVDEVIQEHPEWAGLSEGDDGWDEFQDAIDELSEDSEGFDVSYYVAVYVKGNDPWKGVVAEAEETAKQFLARKSSEVAPPPSTFPSTKYWRHAPGGNKTKRVAGVRGTTLRAHPREGYAVRYHNTDVLTFDRVGNAHTNTGGYYTNTTFSRMNDHLPKGWRVYKYRFTWYWDNYQWPEDLRDELGRLRRLRAAPGRHLHFLPYNTGDWIDRIGNLHTNNNAKVVTVDGQITRQQAVEPVQEGAYQQKLDWINRVRKKHAKMKEVAHRVKDLENIDKPDKRKKRMNLH